jgi:hypothetical protein
LFISLVVRVWGADWQLPWQFHPDEGHYTWKALDLIGEESLNPKYFRNPSLFTYLLYAQYRLLGFQPPTADEQAATATSLWRPPSGVAFVGRLNSALLGAATVGVVGWIGWRLLGPWAGVVASAFLGLAFIHVRDSHYATNDVPSVFLLMLCIGFCLEILRHPTLGRYLLAGIFGGLATSAKYNAGLFVVPLLIAHGLAISPLLGRPDRSKLAKAGSMWWVAGGRLLVSLAASAFAYLAGTPYTLITFAEFWAGFRTQMRLGGEGWEGQVPGPSGPLYLLATLQGVGLPMLLLAVVGCVLLARERRREAVVLLAFPLAYVLFMLRTELFFVRFALPLTPFVCLFAACGVTLVAKAVKLPALRVAVGLSLAVAALVHPAANVIAHNVLIANEDTRALAARWAVEHVPHDRMVLVEDYTIRDRRPRAYGGPAWQLDTDLFSVNDVSPADPAAELRGRPRYVIISSFQYERFAGAAPRLARQSAFYTALERDGRLIASFGPGHDGASIPFDLEDLYTPFWALERYERPGPTIKIYEVPGS